MSTQALPHLERSFRRPRAVAGSLIFLIGPITVLAGVVWSLIQPSRLTVLHPAGRGFWSLAVEAPLLVILVGVLFHLLVAPGIVEDVAAAEAERDL